MNLWRSRAYGVNVEKAGLSRSNLEEVRWHEAAASEARFHDCRMVSAFFKDAVLTGAQFQRSRLQGAHFEGADLRGARFEQANVADASLVGAVVDEAAAASLSRAVNWRKARFDHETLEIVRRQCNGTLPPGRRKPTKRWDTAQPLTDLKTRPTQTARHRCTAIVAAFA